MIPSPAPLPADRGIERQPAILIQSTPYLDHGHILKAFSQNRGLLSFLSKKKSLSYLAPFSIAECVYKVGKTDLHLLLDGSLIDSLLNLRSSYAILSAAGSIANDLLRSQLPGKSSPDLFALVQSYLKQLPQFPEPRILTASFRLKLLLHEGLIALQAQCCQCQTRAFLLVHGESFCLSHAPKAALRYTADQWETLLTLTFAKTFTQLKQCVLTPCLEERVEHLFEERLLEIS